MPDFYKYIPRDHDLLLQQWTKKKNRNVLLLRGARQVGKSRSVKELGKSFASYLEVNFEEEPEVKNIFSGSRNPEQIVHKLSAFYGTPIQPGETLLFLDEIQECEDAIHTLRFFKEKMNELHVIAAGSLLEFVLKDIPTFGVGRIDSLYVYPLSFGEFIEASESRELRELSKNASLLNPLDQANFSRLMNSFRNFFIIGGLPGVVASFLETRSLLDAVSLLEQVLSGYKADFSKYSNKISSEKLAETFLAGALQAGRKFIYSHVNPHEKSAVYKTALELLLKAGLLYKVYHTSASGIPAGATRNVKKFKIIPFDLGIYHQLVGLSTKEVITKTPEKYVHKGAATEVFVGTELLRLESPFKPVELYYWHRESRSSNAEVDYIIQKNAQLIPIEVKARTKGGMKSMYNFIEEKNSEYGIRISHENFSRYKNIKVIPVVGIESLLF